MWPTQTRKQTQTRGLFRKQLPSNWHTCIWNVALNYYTTDEMWSETYLLFIWTLFPSGGHFGSRDPLAGASLQQINPRGSGALLVLKVKQHILVQREVLLVPAVVFCGFFTQVPAFDSLFTREHGQKKRVSFIITHALLHLTALTVTLNPSSSSSSHTAARDDDL